MRKLPVYLLIDTSGSMLGEPIEAVKNGIQILVSTLRQDPNALETVFLSIITFDSNVQQIVPLTELTSFMLPEFSAHGQTHLGSALSLLASKIETEVAKTTPTQKGDWKPLVFIMTDGAANDNLEAGIDSIKNARTGIIVACAAGANADINKLEKITENVVQLDTFDAPAISKFFLWLSDSIRTSSQKIEAGSGEITSIKDLPQPPDVISIV